MRPGWKCRGCGACFFGTNRRPMRFRIFGVNNATPDDRGWLEGVLAKHTIGDAEYISANPSKAFNNYS